MPGRSSRRGSSTEILQSKRRSQAGPAVPPKSLMVAFDKDAPAAPPRQSVPAARRQMPSVGFGDVGHHLPMFQIGKLHHRHTRANRIAQLQYRQRHAGNEKIDIGVGCTFTYPSRGARRVIRSMFWRAVSACTLALAPQRFLHLHAGLRILLTISLIVLQLRDRLLRGAHGQIVFLRLDGAQQRILARFELSLLQIRAGLEQRVVILFLLGLSICACAWTTFCSASARSASASFNL